MFRTFTLCALFSSVMQSKKAKTEDCLCGKEITGPCDRCGKGEVSKPALCNEDGHFQFICGVPKVACQKCEDEGWTSNHGEGGRGTWSNKKEEAQPALNQMAREILFQICDDFDNMTISEFVDSMKKARVECKKNGFY